MHFAESVTSTKRSHVKRNKVEITTRVRICCRLEVSAKGRSLRICYVNQGDCETRISTIGYQCNQPTTGLSTQLVLMQMFQF